MAKLNVKDENTKKIIHLLLTEKCNRDCPYCCNKQYDMKAIERVTDEELREAEIIFLTGGEPFAFSDPCGFAVHLKKNYPNIKKVYAYTNAFELMHYLFDHQPYELFGLDGLTISIKDKRDKYFFEEDIVKSEEVCKLESNWVYVFPEFEDAKVPDNFVKKLRFWQEDFVPDPNSIFRRLF